MLRPALEAVAAGKVFAEPTTALQLRRVSEHRGAPGEMLVRLDPEGVLPRRCRRVVLLAAYGWSDREMAEYLHQSVETIGTYLRTAYGRLGIHSRRELRDRCRPTFDV